MGHVNAKAQIFHGAETPPERNINSNE